MLNTEVTILDEHYDDLANAIITQAAYDYKRALNVRNEALISECERFFKSEWYQELTDLPSDIIVNACRNRTSKWR